MIRIAINGFGRIGRVFFRLAQERNDMEIVAINDLADEETLAHLLKYDSVHGRFKYEVSFLPGYLVVNGRKIRCVAEKDPSQLPWKEEDIDVVIESTGKFLDREGAGLHLKAGAHKVIISAPSKGEDIFNVVLGVNDEKLERDESIISNASCTTNCAAPMVKIIDDICGIESCYISTIHSYTGDQRLHDAPHKDLRRSRAAAVSIIPTSTGAAKAVTRIFPHLNGLVGGCGIRVPVPDGSLTDITFIVKNPLSQEDINKAFKKASENELSGILGYTDDPIVSVDCVGSQFSCIFDAQLTSVIGKMVKVVGWYDNETGYSARLVDLVASVGRR